MGYALSVILTSLQIWACSLLFDVFFERRYTGKKFYALLVLWMAVMIVVANILQNRIGALLFLCEIAAFYLMNVTLYKGSWDRRIFVTVTQYAGAFSISYLTQLLFAFVMSISWEELVNQRALYTGVLFINLIEFFSLPHPSPLPFAAYGTRQVACLGNTWRIFPGMHAFYPFHE